MIYLITGNMGTGKTSRAVAMILNNEDGLFKMTLEDGTVVDRPLYFCHIDGLDTQKLKAHQLTEEQIQSAPLGELLPTGAVLIVDEAHYTYPVRSASKGVPEYVQKLAELRHDGHTLILMTQHPMQLDIFVRNLVSKHVHLERKAVGMKQYWWYKCVTSLDNPAALSGTESASWKPPKEAFAYYKSSSQHVKFKKQIPLAVYALIAIIGLIIWKGWAVYQSYDKATNGSQVEMLEGHAQTDMGGSVAASSPSGGGGVGGNLTADAFVPTLAEKPESKPIYNNVRQVKTFERLAACVSGGKTDCTCYSDQATPLREITKEMCQKYAKDGLPFDPYREPPQTAQNAQNSAVEPSPNTSSTPSGQVAELGGKSRQNLMYDGYVEAGQKFK